MTIFTGAVKAIGGEFRTWQELIAAAMSARVIGTAAQEAEAISRMGSVVADIQVKAKAGDFYYIDAYKGVRNGVTTQASWAAANFTDEPGGGVKVLFTDPPVTLRRVPLGNQVVYAVADTVLYIDVKTI